MEEINSEFKKARRDVELLSIAGTNFFHIDCPIIYEIQQMCRYNVNCNLRILLLDPCSKHAIDRAIIEAGFDVFKEKITSFEYLQSSLWLDLYSSLNKLEKVLKKNKNNKVFKMKLRLYDTAPMLLMAHINNRVFLEQYHYGIIDDRKEDIQCIGRKVPVVEYSFDSYQGQLWKSHFDYLWNTSINREVYPGFCKLLTKKMQEDKIWLEIFHETMKISEKYLKDFNKSENTNEEN